MPDCPSRCTTLHYLNIEVGVASSNPGLLTLNMCSTYQIYTSVLLNNISKFRTKLKEEKLSLKWSILKTKFLIVNVTIILKLKLVSTGSTKVQGLMGLMQCYSLCSLFKKLFHLVLFYKKKHNKSFIKNG